MSCIARKNISFIQNLYINKFEKYGIPFADLNDSLENKEYF